jgi:hypothetical protein
MSTSETEDLQRPPIMSSLPINQKVAKMIKKTIKLYGFHGFHGFH